MTTERWALVPVEPNGEQIDAGRRYNTTRNVYEAMIQASPGAALLAEVLAARDALHAANNAPARRVAIHDLLAALGKLGPAQEGAT